MIDQQRLLMKYVAHVIECEGVAFITDHARHSRVVFTAEELAELMVLESNAGVYLRHLPDRTMVETVALQLDAEDLAEDMLAEREGA
jgi:hypothetical protein